MPSCYVMGQFYTLDGKSLYDLDPNGFIYLNISEVILVKGLWNYNLPAVLTDEHLNHAYFMRL